MPKIFIFFLLISLNLFSLTLNDTYYVNSNNIKLLDVVPDAKYNITIYKIDNNRYTKRVKSTELIKLLNKHGVDSVESSSRYVKFIKKSPIDTSKIEDAVIKRYKNKYPSIDINSVFVTPRGYLSTLPEKYEIIMPRKAHLSSHGTLSIKTPDRKKIFFDYIIDAKLSVYTSKKNIRRGDRVSLSNTDKKTVRLDKFKALPMDAKHLDTTQFKQHTKPYSVITIRDIEMLDIVRKGTFVSVSLNNKNINISFSAKALQNGKLNDIITVQKSSGQRLQAKIIGTNRVEIR